MGQAASSPTKPHSYCTTSRGTVQSVVLVTGVTGKASRQFVLHLLHTGAAVRALTRNAESAGLPGDVVRRDLSVPDTLDTCLTGSNPSSWSGPSSRPRPRSWMRSRNTRAASSTSHRRALAMTSNSGPIRPPRGSPPN